MFVDGENLLVRAVVPEVGDVQPDGLRRRGPESGVEPEVAEHQVRAAVAVQVRNGDAVPPPFRSREPGLARPIDELAVLVVEHAYRHPLPRDDQVEPAVVVVVDPGGRGDHADLGEARGFLARHIAKVSRAVVLE